MKIISLELKNIGLYKNQTFKFDENDKSLTVFWGNNGAGKTTFLNSIKISLLGKKAFNLSLDNYLKFVKDSIISSRVNLAKSKAYVKIKISLKEHNENNIYTIYREWKLKDELLDETVKIFKDDKQLSFIEEENILNKINILLPPTLLDVIIFDGENAINILNNDEMHKLIQNIIYAVFGMDVYSNLIKDLNTYLRNFKKTENSFDDEFKMFELESNYRKYLSDFNKTNLIKEQLQEKMNSLHISLSQNLKILSKSSGIQYNEIYDFKESLKYSKDNKKNLEDDIKYINEEILPLKILHSKIKKLIEKVELEKPLLIMNNIQSLQTHFKNDNQALSLIEQLKNKINFINIPIKYNLSDSEYKLIENLDLTLSNYTKEKLTSYFHNKDSAFIELKEKLNASNILENKESKELIEKIECLYREIESLQNDFIQIEDEFNEISFYLANAKEQYEAFRKDLLTKKKKSSSYLNVSLYKDAIEEFLMVNTEDICNKLNKKIINELKRIKFRNDSITNVIISPKTFKISLYEKNDKLIQTKLFSAGEKQLLLGLIIKESLSLANNDTFFLFDTPVGRLDMKNRNIFTNEVILNVSDQVCIFATDSDYSKEDYKLIKNKITSEFNLLRNDKDEIIIKKGSIYND